ncbi:MAG: hypothetical protein ACPGSC_04635 [Granulosicoccaceae bacterium]
MNRATVGSALAEKTGAAVEASVQLKQNPQSAVLSVGSALAEEAGAVVLAGVLLKQNPEGMASGEGISA